VPFTRDEIKGLLQGKAAAEMFNFRSPNFKKTGLTKEEINEEKMIDLMLQEPRLVRRPVVRINGKVYFSADAKVLAGII
jgi:arsenate reductase-like glutaredoxin family protein